MNKETANKKNLGRKLVQKRDWNVGQNCNRLNVNFFPFIPRKRDTIEKRKNNNSKKQNGRKIRPRRTLAEIWRLRHEQKKNENEKPKQILEALERSRGNKLNKNKQNTKQYIKKQQRPGIKHKRKKKQPNT